VLILVTGATGTLGRPVVDELRARGHEVRALSRRPHEPQAGVTWFTGSLATGAGLAAAADGVDVIVHSASNTRKAGKGDVDSTRNLLAVAGDAHVIFVSIVGVDRLPLGYYKVKWAVEQLVARQAKRWTIIRATQFHDLIRMMADRLAKSPIVPVFVRTSVQPVAVEEVAIRVADLAEAPPVQGRAPDMGGPEVRTMGDLCRTYLRQNGKRRLLLPVWVPGRVGRGLRAGYGTCPQQADGKTTFAEYLSRS
jgi:uncharacterized protein YbjT (DUF2867 family)